MTDLQITPTKLLTLDPTLKPTVLIYQQDEDYDYLEEYLTSKELTIITADKEDVELKVAALNYDFAILDFYKEVGDLSLLTTLKALDPEKPVIMLTERDSPNHEYFALKQGADLYYTRPYSMECLYLLIVGINKRRKAPQQVVTKDRNSFADVTLDTKLDCLVYGQDVIALQPMEMEIMKYLFNHRNEFIDKKTLQTAIYGQANAVIGKRLDVWFHHLRRKLQDTPLEIKAARSSGNSRYGVIFQQKPQ